MAVCLLLLSSLKIAPIPVCPDSPSRCVLHSVSHNPHASADMYIQTIGTLSLAQSGKDDQAGRTTTAKSTSAYQPDTPLFRALFDEGYGLLPDGIPAR